MALVRDNPDGDVVFGSSGDPQIIIKWCSIAVFTSDISPKHTASWINETEGSLPTIYLRDATLEIILRIEPTDIEGVRIEGQEYHRLKGYATICLQRWFNTETLLADDDPRYAETANLTVALAVLVSRSLRRLAGGMFQLPKDKPDLPPQCYLGTEQWRLFDSSEVLFDGIELDKRTITSYVNHYSTMAIAERPVPPSIRNHLGKAQTVEEEIMRRLGFLQDIQRFVTWIIMFAQVIDIVSCADLPLIVATASSFPVRPLLAISRYSKATWDKLSWRPIEILPEYFF